MKYVAVITSLILLCGCNEPVSNTQQVQAQIDSLQNKLNNTYKPGLGEFMMGLQTHHAKLWFAGTNNNWKLADFEIGEIKETIDDIQKFDADRPEVKSIGMIDPAIEGISSAIKKQDPELFRSSYTVLTNTCNNCHLATNHTFNVIKMPDNSTFSNQDFRSGK
jgi:hypothetical protein